MCDDAHHQLRTRSSDRTATEPSVSLAAVDANIAKQMRAEFVTQRLLKFVTQWLLEFGTASLGEARRMASLTAHQGRDPATRAQVSLSQGWHELLGITCAISHSLANAAMIIFPGVARSQSRAIWKETMPQEREKERKLDAIKAELAQQRKRHRLILAVVTVLAAAVLGFLLVEILDMRQMEHR